MDKETRVKMKRLIERKQKAVKKTNEIGYELDQLIVEEWGIHYSETDDDSMIDSLDYGTSGISFKHFCERMNSYKNGGDGNS